MKWTKLAKSNALLLNFKLLQFCLVVVGVNFVEFVNFASGRYKFILKICVPI